MLTYEINPNKMPNQAFTPPAKKKMAYFETRTGLGLGLGLGPEENPDSGKTRTRARTRV